MIIWLYAISLKFIWGYLYNCILPAITSIYQHNLQTPPNVNEEVSSHLFPYVMYNKLKLLRVYIFTHFKKNSPDSCCQFLVIPQQALQTTTLITFPIFFYEVMPYTPAKGTRIYI